MTPGGGVVSSQNPTRLLRRHPPRRREGCKKRDAVALNLTACVGVGFRLSSGMNGATLCSAILCPGTGGTGEPLAVFAGSVTREWVLCRSPRGSDPLYLRHR